MLLNRLGQIALEEDIASVSGDGAYGLCSANKSRTPSVFSLALLMEQGSEQVHPSSCRLLSQAAHVVGPVDQPWYGALVRVLHQEAG